jgi:glycolate oxidase
MEAGAELIARARLICGEQHVITHPSVLCTYGSDGLRRGGPPRLPLAAILPGSPSEVANVVSACAAIGVPLNVRGAGTSRDGGALPVTDGVLVVLSRMRRVIALAEDEVTVEAGAPLSDLLRLGAVSLQDGVEPLGTIGGYVAQTSGVTNIAALELVRPNGEVARLDSRQPGYDLTGAFPGTRGRGGIAVVLTLRTEYRR